MMQTVKATIAPGYRWRLVLISLVMLGFGVYCVYDWQIGYPNKKLQYDTYTQIREDHPDTYPEVWAERAAAEGWSVTTPERKTDTDILTQLIMALITLPIGLYFLVKLIRESLRWVAMDDAGLTASGGHAAPWPTIASLDDAKWKTKGIAWVHYRPESGGGEKRILLDDFKSQREPVQTIVRAVQQHLGLAAADTSAAPVDPPPPATAEGDLSTDHDPEPQSTSA